MAVFEVSDPDVVIELMIRRNSAAAGGSIDKNSNAGSKKHSRTSSVAEEETAEEPDAKRAANSAGKIASDEPPSDITHSVESGSIIDQLMRRIEETHSRQEIEVSVTSLMGLSVSFMMQPVDRNIFAQSKELLRGKQISQRICGR